MDRRELIKLAGGLLLSGVLTTPTWAAPNRPIYAGWLDLPEARQSFVKSHEKPFLRQHDAEIKGSGEDKQILLWPFYEQVTGAPHVPHVQDIGDCVGQASGLGVDFLTTVQIAFHRKNEEWKGKCSTEVIYAGSRVEIGKGAIRRGGGSTGAWAAEWLNKYGAVLRGKYGEIDLTNYSPELAARWGRRITGAAR